MPPSDPSLEVFEACNTTELYQLCRKAGLTVAPDASRENMIAYLWGDAIPPRVDHPMHLWRNGLIGLIQDYWVTIEPQLSCPAKELGPPAGLNDPPKPDPSDRRAPKACYTCEDAKVIYCLVDNAPQEKLIELRRKKNDAPPHTEEDTSMNMAATALTKETAPRSAAELEKLQRFMRKRLMQDLGYMGTTDMVAFIDADDKGQAQRLEQELKRFDEQRAAGGTGAPAPSTAAPAATNPTPTPVTSAATEAVPARTPRNGTKKNEEAGGGGTNTAGVEALLGAIAALREDVAALRGEVNAMKTQNAQAEARGAEVAAGRHATIMKALEGVSGLLRLALGASMVLAENQLGMAPPILIAEATEAGGPTLDRLGAVGKA